jgi:Ca-activated chloride channel homolog
MDMNDTNDSNADKIDEAQLTAYALGQLDDAERAAVEDVLARSPGLRQRADEIAAMAEHVRRAYEQSPSPAPSAALRDQVERELAAVKMPAAVEVRPARSFVRRPWFWMATTAAVCLVVCSTLLLPQVQDARNEARQVACSSGPKQVASAVHEQPAAAISSPPNGPPICYPDAEKWRQLSARRPAKYTTQDIAYGACPALPGDVNGYLGGDSSRERAVTLRGGTLIGGQSGGYEHYRPRYRMWPSDTEQYDRIVENVFRTAAEHPLSTFSIDVDTASYANVRRFLNGGRLPPPDAVRIEEMVNYFHYDYAPPEDAAPLAVHLETAQCPWQKDHRLVRIGLKGREIDRRRRGPSNLVFLLDVSGSMADENKLPLVKQAMRLLVEQLTEDDRVAIVTYASDTAVRLPSARGNERRRILETIDSLEAGGCTYGSAGIELAYRQAAEHFVTKGVNRVILCTDGDLNVGVTNDDDLVRLIRKKARSGVFLTILGFGEGNLKDSKMEKIADKGNGVYAYIDCLREAHRVLVEQMTGTLATIAKDVKIQIEFNPAEVESYRLLGYENRVMANRDFANDRKDAGDVGAGHTVTALFEIVPAGRDRAASDSSQPLKYQRPAAAAELTPRANSGELLTLRIRYKEPDGQKSRLLEFTTKDSRRRFGQASADFRFASAVAALGMVLRDSRRRGNATLAAVEEYAAGTLGNDPSGYRAEFLDLVRKARTLAGDK